MKKLTSDKIIIFLIVMIIPLGPLAMDLYFPSLPAMVMGLQTTKTAVQLSLTVYILGLGLSQLFYGPLSDRFGRRKIILTGTAIFFLASLGCALAHTIDQLLWFRFIQGLGFGCGFVVASAIMADVFTDNTLAKVSSYSAMSYSITPIIAPVIGGYLQQYLGWRANFGFMAIYTIALLLLLFFLLPETNQHPDPHATKAKSFFGGYWQMSINQPYMCYVLCMTLSYGIMIAFSIVGPFLLQNLLNLSAVQYGQLALLVGLAYFFSTTINSRLVKHYSVRRLLVIGTALLGLGSVLLVISSLLGWLSILTIMVPTCIAIFGMGFIFPNAMANALAIYPQKTGRSSALMGSYTLIGCTLISAWAAHMHVQTSQPLALIYLVLSVLTAVAVYFAE